MLRQLLKRTNRNAMWLFEARMLSANPAGHMLLDRKHLTPSSSGISEGTVWYWLVSINIAIARGLAFSSDWRVGENEGKVLTGSPSNQINSTDPIIISSSPNLFQSNLMWSTVQCRECSCYHSPSPFAALVPLSFLIFFSFSKERERGAGYCQYDRPTDWPTNRSVH